MKNILNGPFTEWKSDFTPEKLLGCFTNPGPATTNTPNVGSGGSWPDGYRVGNTSQSPVGFYGVTPAAVQRSNGNQANFSNTQANATLVGLTVSCVWPSSGTISATTISPIAVVFQSCGFVSSTDVLLVNKILPQAGVGILQARVSTVSTVLLQYVNMTNSNVTQTVTETVIATNFRGMAQNVTLSPPSIAANTIAEATFTVTGLTTDQLTYVVKPSEQLGLGIVGSRVVSNNTLGISFINNLTTAITPTASEVYSLVALNGLFATNNMMVAKVVLSAGVGTVNTITGVTTRTIAVTGFAVSDDTLAIQRTLSQQDLALVGVNVNAANQLALTYVNTGQTASPVTPTPGETYVITMQRPQLPQPLVIQSVALTPTIIGALTTTELTFAVSNITVSTVVWANKPTFTSGLGVVGMRAVSTNVIGITYINNTTASITPPAETYLVGNFPTILGAGHRIEQQVMSAPQTGFDLTAEIRTALVNMGIIAGS
jgi:hypothetical protein